MDLMGQHAHQALPGFQFLFAQGTREIGDHQKLVRQAPLAEGAAADAPARHSAREVMLNGLLRFAFQIFFQAQRAGFGAQQPLRGLIQQPFGGAIHQAHAMIAVEGEHRHVDLLHHLAQQRGGFERSQPLLP